ncbi:hypothetical protein BUALT_Bualt01G0096800 [Buddleja alternifolia]|uniref:DUF4216 domain-containing protein n=1 Tax=Buddleja alternifolia TaxID=168488 RepID=A0AAV6Y5U5_9LAMI|nr:hypothetical protein BUALT_Bualt01G0096800 [Buddleja alternifolia]
MYLEGIETHFNKEERNFDVEVDGELSVFSQKLRPFGATKYVELSKNEQDKAHWYILNNCEEVERFQEEHREVLKRESPLHLEERHKDQFSQWFKQHITHLKYHNQKEVTDEIYALACGPHIIVKKYPGCIVNGVRFHTKERDSHRTTQNSGVMVEGYHDNKAIKFYGIVTEIIELDYVKDKRVVLFKAQWFNSGGNKSTIQVDGKITSITISRTWYEDDPFVLASQTKQVFYMDDVKLGKNWRIVQEFQHRHVFDTLESDVVDIRDDHEVYQEDEHSGPVIPIQVEVDELTPLDRNDIAPEVVETEAIQDFENDFDDMEDNDEEEDDTLINYCDIVGEHEIIEDDSDLD